MLGTLHAPSPVVLPVAYEAGTRAQWLGGWVRESSWVQILTLRCNLGEVTQLFCALVIKWNSGRTGKGHLTKMDEIKEVFLEWNKLLS